MTQETHGDDGEHVGEGHVGDEHEEDTANVGHHRSAEVPFVQVKVDETEDQGKELHRRDSMGVSNEERMGQKKGWKREAEKKKR